MKKEASRNNNRFPGIGMYFFAIILGSGASFFLATYWLEFTPYWIALLVGAVFSTLGAFLGETVGDAIMFSLISVVTVTVFITLVPGIAIVRVGIIPVVTGLCVGKLLVGVWKEVQPQ
jgi:hypothetical protein